MKKACLLFLSMIISGFICAQNGSISGSIKDSTTNEEIIGALIQIEGTELGASADFEGNFIIMDVPPGTYNLKIQAIGYEPLVLRNIVVRSGENTEVNTAMKVPEIGVVKVKGRRITNSSSAVVEEIKEADIVSSGIAKEEITRTGDRDAAQVVRRIPSVTLMDNRFVNIRGLNERYNTTLINGIIAPSSEQDIKAFSMDLFSSSMIDRIMVYKTPSAEQQGEFAGGVVNIFTPGIPNNLTYGIKIGTGMTPGVTGKTFLEQKQGKYFWLADDDGLYTLDDDFPTSEQVNNDDRPGYNRVAKKKMNLTFLPEERKAPLDFRLSGNIGGSFKVWKNIKLGSFSAISYSNTRNSTEILQQFFNGLESFDKDEEPILDTSKIIKTIQYEQNVRISAMQNIGVKIGNNHSIEFKNFYNRQASSSYSDRVEQDVDLTQELKYNISSNLFRKIYAMQLAGSHEFVKNLKLEWIYGYSKTIRDEPGLRSFAQYRDIGDSIYRNWVQTSSSFNRFSSSYFNTEEVSNDVAFNLSYILNLSENFQPEFHAGYYNQQRERNFGFQAFEYRASKLPDAYSSSTFQLLSIDSLFSDKYFLSSDLLLANTSTPSDEYSATNDLKAYYTSIKLAFKNFVFYPGVRYEKNIQTVNGYELVSRDEYDTISVENKTNKFLPSINFSYELAGKHKFRLGYGKTLNRPILRELQISQYFNYFDNSNYKGNPYLETAEVFNYDLRYEWYPNAGETITIGPFYKHISKPIERVQRKVSGGGNNYGYLNSERAYVYGVEIEVRKKLGTFFNRQSFLDYLGIVLNSSLVKSEVLVKEIEEVDERHNFTFEPIHQKRALQGQSPFVFNAGLYYQNDSLGLVVNLSYNTFGERLAIVGSEGIDFPFDIIEASRDQLDFSLSKSFYKNFSARVSIRNILDAPVRLYQDVNKNQRISESDPIFLEYKNNRYYSFSLAARF